MDCIKLADCPTGLCSGAKAACLWYAVAHDNDVVGWSCDPLVAAINLGLGLTDSCHIIFALLFTQECVTSFKVYKFNLLVLIGQLPVNF